MLTLVLFVYTVMSIVFFKVCEHCLVSVYFDQLEVLN